MLLLATQTCDAQRLISKSSRHYVSDQSMPERVDPLLGDEAWHQYYAPYNDLCPMDSTGEFRTVAGCVALAMGQVMHYWEWPRKYFWEDMLPTYEGVKYSLMQGHAVAMLLRDCGKSVNMNYGAASGAQSIMQPLALTYNFGYSKTLQYLFRDFYSLEEITLMLKTELAAGRPILVSGFSQSLAHAFVIDGYDENDCFHIRLGNPNNDGDCWTYLPNMTPDQPKWHDMNSPEGGMNLLQSFVIGIVPEGRQEPDAVERHCYAFQYMSAVTDNDSVGEAVYARNDVRLTVHDMSNIGWNIHVDSVALMLKKDSKAVAPLYTYKRRFLLEEIEDSTYTDTMSIAIPEDVADGAYSIVPMYRDNAAGGGYEWREARTCTGTPNYLIAAINGDEVRITSDTLQTAYLTLEDYYFPDVIVNGKRNTFHLTLKNHNTEICGRFYLLMEPLEKGVAPFYLQEQGVTMMAGEESTRTFTMTETYAPRLGKYRLHIMYESNLFADYLMEFELDEEIIIDIIGVNAFLFAER